MQRAAHAGLANGFLHALGSAFSGISQHCSESLFSFGYVLSFTVSDGTDSMRGNAVQPGDMLNPRVRVG